MPTPSDNTPPLNASSIAEEISARSTCPPEVERLSSWRDSRESSTTIAEGDAPDSTFSPTIASTQTALTPSDDAVAPSNADPLRGEPVSDAPMKGVARPEDEPAAGRLSPAAEPSRSSSPSAPVTSPSATSLLSYEFSNIRLLPNYTSSFLRPGSKFTGTQQSDRQVYSVDVEIKHVDMLESFLCGYLRIQGLTEDHPTLTTFFEGEIIGTKHTFKTRNEAWGATEKTDMHHWARFPPWRTQAKQAKRPDFTFRNFAQREHLFMRWKEYFLVPDHRVRSISGASFEGFYYICFNQVEGTVAGIYFHAKSEKYQQLELRHVEDHGCTPAMEFR
ncbi:vacuolar import and degradation protein [Aspergillus ellipticus CBS 707.79]|uniref:Vacuolar import and degradation protein n=1 Tax=Aspergillus ellipticus CBS 707.79 TaxID=1448320 RepID=A0A319DPL2_9EURO|nr:vacuolar import and degradation protein [Aspergillus ellipticus CBS 707.79]